MSFASPVFLWYFLPLTLTAYWVLPRRFRNALMSVVSLLFYAWGAGAFVVGLLAVIVVNYAAGLALDDGRLNPSRRRALLVATVGFDLGILAVWKYAGFASEQVAALGELLGQPAVPVVQLALPIGISFFTFHHLSYVVDVYRQSRHALRSPVQFVTYIAMFPQLVAGPIVRYHEIADQLPEVRSDRFDDFVAGFPRFALGLAKKVVVADSVAPIADAAFDTGGGDLTTAAAWVGVLAYTLQIYFDFSGYSDMAIGLGRMFGFRLPENFARPYSAVSITDFWRRWHMSLSRWFRDYLYIPLGGNRGSTAHTYRNLYIVFLATGIWHGADWTFLVWGLYHGTMLAVERATGLGQLGGTVAVLPRRALTFLLVVVGWVPFRAESMGEAGAVLRAMFVPTWGGLPPEMTAALTDARLLTLVLAGVVVTLPAGFVMGRVLDEGSSRIADGLRVGYAALAAPYAAVVVAAGTFSPFLYFQF